MTFTETVEYLFARLPMYQRVGAPALKPSLQNTIDLLAAIGNPHHNFKSVHIAGTNGKGSSAHAMASILQMAGFKTGLYTSPHLKSFSERIRIDGTIISESSVVQFVKNHKNLIEKIKPSFFEVTVAMAFDYFAKEKVDLAIIEVGLGGRLDSTNVIQPEVCLITMIGWDHSNLLGDTLEKIAGEKAGIIKAGIPVVIGADQPELLSVFENKARELNAPLYISNDIIVNKNSKANYLIDLIGKVKISKIEIDLKGDYFLKNIPGIINVIILLRNKGWQIEDDHIKMGLGDVIANTGLKGRWQKLSDQPMVIADIAHNESGLEVVLNQVKNQQFNHLHIIYGTVSDKEVDKILSLFPKLNTTYYFTTADVPRAMSVTDLVKAANLSGFEGAEYRNVNEALMQAKKVADKADLILICGSTFVVSEIEGL